VSAFAFPPKMFLELLRGPHVSEAGREHAAADSLDNMRAGH
jgi:hypothetical protein